MVLPFGRYKGTNVADAPQPYLEWLLTWEPLREPLRSAVEMELARREALRARPPVKIDVQVADAIIRAGVRTLAKGSHPDTGGNNAQMAKINACADALREMVGA